MTINDCIKETLAGARLNLAEKFNEKSQDGNGIFSYTLRSRVCKGLDFSTLEFKNMDIDGFDFRQSNFGSKKEVNFSGSTFKDVNFAESKLRGKTIDLSNTTFDMASFRSIQPLLDKALKEGKGIKTEGMKITVSNLKDREELETMKKSAFGKLYLDPNTPGKDKVKFTTKEKKEVATEMSPTPTRPFAERATNPAVPPLPLR